MDARRSGPRDGRALLPAILLTLLALLTGGVLFLRSENRTLEEELRRARTEAATRALARAPEGDRPVPEGSGAATDLEAAEIAALRAEIDRLRAELDRSGGPEASEDSPEDTFADGVIPITLPNGDLVPIEMGSFQLTRFGATGGSNPDAPSWSENQATGEPDTTGLGDFPTAWASREPDAGEEWLEIDFTSEVVPLGIVIVESFNPGAVTRVEVARSGGGFRRLWSGTDPATEERNEFFIPYAGGTPVGSVRIILDTTRVPGWNEIDAVGLETADGTIWGSAARASSSYARRLE